MTLDMKKTLMISLLLHVFFFSAAFLWSAHLFEGSGEKTDTNVLFVRLLGEKHAEAEAQNVIRRDFESMEAVRVLTDTKEPEPREPLMIRERTVLHYHNPEPAVEESSVEESDASESLGPVRSEAVEQFTGDTDVTFSAVDGEGRAENGGQDGDGLYEGVNVRPDPYEDVYGTGMSGGSVPADVIRTIRNAIERFKTYPLAARRRGTEGVVHVSFSITPEGKPEQVRIVRSSGSRLLDRATIDTVKRASPYPYVNSSLEVPVMYRLEE